MDEVHDLAIWIEEAHQEGLHTGEEIADRIVQWNHRKLKKHDQWDLYHKEINNEKERIANKLTVLHEWTRIGDHLWASYAEMYLKGFELASHADGTEVYSAEGKSLGVVRFDTQRRGYWSPVDGKLHGTYAGVFRKASVPVTH
jgi:hypothetical protein